MASADNLRWPPRTAAFAWFGVVAAVYAATVLLTGHHNGEPIYFNHLADAFLHGRLHLANPPGVHDLTEFEGRWYVPFPPLPALLLIPWVAVSGPLSVNATGLSIVIGALTVVVVRSILLELAARRWIELEVRGCAWLTALFAFGTVHWYLACDGSVWFLSQICTTLFAAAATLLAIRLDSALPAGAALAIAMLARPNIVFLWPLLAGIAAMKRGSLLDGEPSARMRRCCLASLAPLALSVAILMSYNLARFRNPLDFGYGRQNIETSLKGDLLEYGQFAVQHVPRNIRLILFETPELPRDSLLPRFSDRGMGIVFTSPALALAFATRRRDPLTRGAWLAVAALLVPLLLYYNTGWRQFGYRFTLDFLVPLLVLLAIAAGPRVSRLLLLLILVSIAINLCGSLWWFTTPIVPPE